MTGKARWSAKPKVDVDVGQVNKAQPDDFCSYSEIILHEDRMLGYASAYPPTGLNC